jgi:hypothetical protein
MMNDSIAPSTRQNGRRKVNRRATTLVEILGTLSVLLVLGVAAAGMLGAITEIGVRANTAKQSRGSARRLADVIRRDVHDAGRVNASNAWPLDLITGNVTIRYEWNAPTHCIRRTAKEGQTQQAVDRFQLPDHCDPRVSTSDERVTVVLWDGGQTQRPWIIEAGRK